MPAASAHMRVTGPLRRAAGGLAAAAALATFLVGLPVGLATVAGNPLPHRIPTVAEAWDALTTPDDGSLLLRLLTAVGWAAWAIFLAAVLLEALARITGRRAPLVPGLHSHQRLAGMLIAAVASALATPAVAQSAAAPVPAITAAATADPTPPAVATQPTQPPPQTTLHLVARGEGLLDLQDRYGTTWKRIAAANYGTIQPDGRSLQPGQTRIYPGWQLRIPGAPPANSTAADGGHPTPAAGHQTLAAPATMHTHPPPETTTSPTPTAAADQPATEQLRYHVARGDWMWHIADRYLGDPQRYPQIAALNPHLDASYDTFPDHIEPGDELLLPADARDRGPRHHATGDVTPLDEPSTPAPSEPEPPPPPEGPDRSPGSPSPQPSPRGPGSPADPDGVVPGPTATPTPTPEPTTPAGEPATSPTPPAEADPSPGSGAAGEDTDDRPANDDGDGVVLGDGSWIPWAVAAALAAAMAVVWLQRRRRYRPRRLDEVDAETGELYLEEDPDPAALAEPATVSRIRRALRSRSRGAIPDTAPEPEPAADEPAPGPGPQPVPESEVAQPASATEVGLDRQPALLQVAAVELLPEGGTGIVGPGAEAAARGALVAALSAGAPVDPDAQAEVVVPAEVMVTLLGADAVRLGTWRRLRVTPDLDSALALVEARLLSTARLLDEYETEDLAGLRAAAPAERPVPPLLLIAAAPQTEARMRTRNALGLGHGVGVSALLLGPWQHGPTVQVEVDGTCRPATGTGLPPGIPTRLAVLDQQAAFELLATLRQAHTGQAAPPAAAGPVPAPATGPSASAEGADHQPHDEKKTRLGRDGAQRPVHEPAQPAPSAGGEEAGQEEPPYGVPVARARVLGMPEIEGWQAAGRPLRKAAVELLVYLACHPDGAAPEQIQEDLWPDSRRRLAATKLHTAASNLRHLLAAAASADDEQAGAYVRKDKGRYRIPAGPVEIDLWTLRAECDRARRATEAGERIAALRRACQAYRGELAAGRDYEWVTVHREGARALALDAHTTLAEAIAEDDPGEAARLLLAAVEVDPMAEAVYRQAMQACHRIGDGETIRSLLRQLAGQLEAVGGEPADETIELAEKLHTELNQRPGPAGAA